MDISTHVKVIRLYFLYDSRLKFSDLRKYHLDPEFFLDNRDDPHLKDNTLTVTIADKHSNFMIASNAGYFVKTEV